MGAGTSQSTETSRGNVASEAIGLPPLSLDQAARVERDWRTAQLVTVAEMVESVDALTNAGQRHRMGKVLQFLEPRLTRRFAPEVRPSAARMLARLAQESARSMPRVRPFQVRARALLSLLKPTES